MEALALLFSVLGMVAIVKKLTDVVAYVKGKDWSSVLKVTLAVAFGISVALLFWCSTFAATIEVVPGRTLGSLSLADVVILGLALGMIAAFGTDWLAGIDNTRTSATPSLTEPATPEVDPPAAQADLATQAADLLGR